MLDNKFLNQWLSDHAQHTPIAKGETRLVQMNTVTAVHLGPLTDHAVTIDDELRDGLVVMTIIGDGEARDVAEYQGSLPAPPPPPAKNPGPVRRVLKRIAQALE